MGSNKLYVLGLVGVAVNLFIVHTVRGYTFNFYKRQQTTTTTLIGGKRRTPFIFSHIGDDNDVGPPPMDLPGVEHPLYNIDELESMNVSQLKQQLRLRGMKLIGRKADLINRLLNGDDRKIDGMNEPLHELYDSNATTKEFVDVSSYLEESDAGKSFKSSSSLGDTGDADDENDISSPEVWGTEARLSTSDDYDDKRIVIDSLSRTVLEFKGSNQTYVDAVIVATREALRPYMRGGNAFHNASQPITTAKATEQRLRDIQLKRELEAATPIHFDDTEGLDEGDETGIFENILRREVSDWGKYTVTGAQLSSQEVQGVLLLSDVHGAHSADTIALAEKIAFECQPIIVMVPDLFRGNPWTPKTTDTVNEFGQTYEVWRATHDDLRVSVDIRSAAACLRETYGVSAVVVWGTCYGGGRALEAASGWYESIHDVDGSTIGPPPAEPMVTIAWYPTRYNAPALFGKNHQGRSVALFSGLQRQFAVMCIFAGSDDSPGATPDDAALLKQLLEEDDRIVDHMVKIFPNQSHGFAHIGLAESMDSINDTNGVFEEEFVGAGRIDIADGDADVACLLSTAFMETYSRVFLPTVGPPVSINEEEWGRELTIGDLKNIRNRNIRDELKVLNENFIEEPLVSGPIMDPVDSSNEEELAKLLRSMQPPDYEGKYKLLDDDDLPTIYKKLLSADENFQIF
jgi:dienelactone hydrolase